MAKWHAQLGELHRTVVAAGRYGEGVDAKKDPAGRQALRPGQACVWL